MEAGFIRFLQATGTTENTPLSPGGFDLRSPARAATLQAYGNIIELLLLQQNIMDCFIETGNSLWYHCFFSIPHALCLRVETLVNAYKTHAASMGRHLVTYHLPAVPYTQSECTEPLEAIEERVAPQMVIPYRECCHQLHIRDFDASGAQFDFASIDHILVCLCVFSYVFITFSLV